MSDRNFRHAFDASAQKSNTVDLAIPAFSLWVGGLGDVKVTTQGGDTVTFSAVAAGTLLPVRVTRLWSTGTTATLIIGLY